MEEVKRGPGRPPLKVVEGDKPEFRSVKYVQMHDALTPLQMAPMMSLATEGAKAMASLTEGPRGIEVVHSNGRRFVVPYGNISSYELE